MRETKTEQQIIRMARKAKEAARTMALLPTNRKDALLRSMAQGLKEHAAVLLKANAKDLNAGKKSGLSSAMLDRLALNEKRIEGMRQCLLDTAALKDPVGEILKTWTRPNGLALEKVRVPIGVIGIIYESRPNVTSDCMGLCLKSGNAVILKGGKEAQHSNKAIFDVLRATLSAQGISPEIVQLLPSTDRSALSVLLRLNAYVDLIIPRGGEGLIQFVVENARIPVIKHYKGVCHTYVSDKADLIMAEAVCFNAKVQRPGVCNAMETLLVHENVAEKFLPPMIAMFHKANVEIRGCSKTRRIVSEGVSKATQQDWSEEYLDLILSIKVVADTDEAIAHINTYGSGHSDAIITKDANEARRFLTAVDAACVYENASTRFTDGYEFGFGAEVGVSTDKLHARGPMGLEDLTTTKYLIHGTGQVRMSSIGILGGAFNPIHIGHLIVARAVCEKAHLEKVIFVPAYKPPQKTCRELASATDRYAMVRLAIEGEERFELSDCEIRRKGLSFTIDTVRSLQQAYDTKTRWIFILGEDHLASLNRWKDIEELRSRVTFVCAGRVGYTTQEPCEIKVQRLKTPLIGISSTEIRQRIRKGYPVAHLVPPKVDTYIRTHHLYGA